MTQRKPPGISWQSFAEQQIQEAQEAGKFDNLPGLGKPIPDLGDVNDEWWWIRRKLRSEQLSVLPPALEIRLDVARTLERIWQLPSEGQVVRELAALNERIARANRPPAWGPPSTTMPLDLDQVLDEWRRKNVCQ